MTEETYVVLVTDVKLDLERLSGRDEDLEDEILVNDVEAGSDARLFDTAHVACVMKVGRHLLGAGRKLDALASEAEDVAFDLCVVALVDVSSVASGHRERLVGLGA